MTRFIYVLIAIVYISISTCIVFAEENAENGATIRGEVIELTKENNPIEGVEVKIVNSDGKEWTVKTDAKGKYEFTGLPEGRYTISISKRGYNPRIGRSKVVVAGGERFDRFRMRKKDDTEKRFTEGLLRHAAESIGERYKLNPSKVKALHQSIVDTLDTVLEHENLNVDEFASTNQTGSIGLIIAMLSHPDCKTAFTKHLTKTQLQDYINFTKARQQRVRQAVVDIMAAFLDQALSLTVDQRENLVKLLLDTINDKPDVNLMGIMNGPLPKEIGDLLHNKLHISLDSVLNQTQSKIWEVMIDFYDGKDLVGIEFFEVPSENADEKDEINKVPPKSKKWILVESTLMAHTQQLGTLNDSASKRLNLATKGVIQQYLEAQIPDIDEHFKFSEELSAIMLSFMWQNITREQAAEKLEVMKKELWDKRGTNERWDKIELHQITNHPLYQHTIKDVLSEDIYLQYKARQTERKNYQIQVSQDFILAYIEVLLLPNETQMKQLKTIAAQLTSPSLSWEEMQLLFAELLISMDPILLKLLQQGLAKGGG